MSKAQNYDEDALFRSLVESAFEFLNKSLDEFNESPKFSIVHFATAIELFLKSRLMREHWSLLVEKTDSADRSTFFQGKSKTVNLGAAIQRLAKIAGDPIPEDARKVFEAIAQHRNRMVHFVHGDVAKSKTTASPELEQVAAVQCQGWRQLQLLLEKTWMTYFEPYDAKIATVEAKMQKQRGYLKAKFDTKANEIKVHVASGGKVRACGSCGFDSVLVKHIAGAISSANCVVCRYSGSLVKVDCPTHKCRGHIEFESYEGPPKHCPSCGATIAEWVTKELNTGEALTKDNMIDHFYKNCPYCHGYHSVVKHHEGFVCTECFEYSDTMEICGCCGEGQLGGVPEFSDYFGCEFCYGKAGWDND